MEDVDRLIKFLDGFQAFSRFNRGKIQRNVLKSALEEVLPLLSKLQKLTILDDFEHHKKTIRDSFDKLIKFQYIPRPQNGGPPNFHVAASKILHAINPNLFIMWDNDIERDYWNIVGFPNGKGYAYKFLPEMRRQADEALRDVMKHKSLIGQDDAIRCLKGKRCDHSLAKVLDEFNFAVVKDL